MATPADATYSYLGMANPNVTQPTQVGGSPAFNPMSDGGGVSTGQTSSSTFTPPPGVSPTDPQAVGQYVQWLSQQPGADPTLASDPNYWIQHIIDNGGGLTPDNIGYWNNRSKAGAGDAGGGSAGAGGAGFNYSPSAFVTGPFGQYALKEAQNAVNSNLFSRGLGLSTGAAKDIAGATYGALGQLIPQDYAMQQGQFQTNFNNLNTLAGYGLPATNAAAGYNTGAAAAGAAGTIGANNAQNEALGGVNSSFQNAAPYKSLNPNAINPKTGSTLASSGDPASDAVWRMANSNPGGAVWNGSSWVPANSGSSSLGNYGTHPMGPYQPMDLPPSNAFDNPDGGGNP